MADPLPEWTDTEKWIWQQISAGKVAKLGGEARESSQDRPPPERLVSATFLRTILSRKPFVEDTPATGVRIADAHFDESIDLEHFRVGHQIWLTNCRFDGALNCLDMRVDGWFLLDDSHFDARVNLSAMAIAGNCSMDGATYNDITMRAANIGGRLSMTGCTAHGATGMNGLKVGQSLFMAGAGAFKDVDLTGANVAGQLDMTGSTFDGATKMNDLTVGQSLFIRDGATFKDFDLTGADIGGQLDMTGIAVERVCDMGAVKVGQSLFMSDGAVLRDVTLSRAAIGGQLDMTDSTFRGRTKMGSVTVGDTLYMRRTFFPEDSEVQLFFANIGSNLDLSGAHIGSIDLTGTRITGEFNLGSARGSPTRWLGNSRMILRNTQVGVIQDAASGSDAWPKELVLEGFSYDNLGGFRARGAADFEKRPSSWFKEWLALDMDFSPEPYETLANKLRQGGYPFKASDVFFAGRRRARQEAWKNDEEGRLWVRATGMYLLETTIGYGLGWRYFFILFWVVGMTLVGSFMLVVPGTHDPGDPEVYFASLDQLLPIMTLDGAHEAMVFGDAGAKPVPIAEQPNAVRWYFYLHKIFGWVLGSFLVAGISGLTQRN